MNDIAIKVENISKKFFIGKKQEPYQTLRDTITSAFTAPLRKAGQLLRGHATGAAALDEEIWALEDVSFNVRRGEVIGIIGRNGAGKSTLLKILSRITEPTTGYAEIRGRVGSLLEVGTGFHQELTGRENIYLNGSILGMQRSEIDKNFDEIVAFAEVEKFIDTPVKHYSSGMYLRLAFGVAAHLEPEIMIVDEVLAVGDALFQKKCIKKMEDVGKQGRTVLFVSHNMPAIGNLCERVILLEKGRIVLDGPARQVVSNYLTRGSSTMAVREWNDPDTAPGDDVARLRAVRVVAQDGAVCDSFDIRHSFSIEMEYEVIKPGHVLISHYNIHNEEGLFLFPILDMDPQWRNRPRPVGHYITRTEIPGNLLREGMISVSAGLVTINPIKMQFYESDAVGFHVIDNLDADSSRGDWKWELGGVIRPMFTSTTQIKDVDLKPFSIPRAVGRSAS
jgi:lipopolysaccharide transport system ATP-binding protein